MTTSNNNGKKAREEKNSRQLLHFIDNTKTYRKYEYFFYMKSLCQLRTKPKRIRSRDTCEYEQYALSWIVTTTTTTTTTATIKWHLVNFNWINVIVVACLLSCKCMFTYWLMCSRSCAYAPSPPLPSVMLLLSFSCWLSFSFLLSSPGRFIFNCNLSSARKHRNFSEWIYCQIIQNNHFTIWYSVVLI